MTTHLAIAALLVVAAAGTHRQNHDPSPPIAPGDRPHMHTNRLAESTSPYLLQHAHNPVDWYPWGPEAIERAKKENKAIFLSVGYSTCYWCHVMEREVFENEELAALINERFVCVKVDREERPDLDEIYMTATQLMTGSGGWPNSLFLTPDLKPFFAGTYIGPTDQPGRPGFGTVVVQLGTAWNEQRAQIEEVADRAAGAIKQVLEDRTASIPEAALDAALVDRAVADLNAAHDPRHGGFGVAPKFPNDFYYSLLLDVHADRVASGNPDEPTLAIVTRTLDAMAAGGIHDHVGGGFHRYATDAAWRVPHFEKMLYNQAHLAVAYLDAFALTGEPRFAGTANGIFHFVSEVLTGPHGEFYSALDAETDAVEGAYYTWTPAQIVEVLGAGDAGSFLAEFELADVPVFAGHKHPEGGTLVARRRGEAIAPDITSMLRKLAAVRQQRKLPRLDDKAIAAWNGMMIDAFARGAEVLKSDAYRVAAAKAASFVLERMRSTEGRLIRSVRESAVVNDTKPSPQEGFLEDYAFVIRGLLSLSRIETDPAAKARWLAAAKELAATADTLFWDRARAGYFFAQAQPDLIARGKDAGDGATPSGNSVMVHDNLELWRATGDAAYRDRAESVLKAFSGSMSQAPRNSVHMMHALHRMLTESERDGAPEALENERAGVGPATAAQPTPSPLDKSAIATHSLAHVKADATVTPTTAAAGDTVTVIVTLRIDEGWHVNANPASSSELIATSLDVRSGETALELIAVSYPAPAILKPAALSDDEWKVYSGTVQLSATVRLPRNARAGEPIQLRAMVTLQACSDKGVCLAPSEWSQPLQVQILPSP